jgi:glycosyltransferase involved in cell wall biosynthesis
MRDVESVSRKVSVVIPTFDDARFLARAIDSVLAQSYSSIEIIVVDDTSDQEALAVLSEKYPDKSQIAVQRYSGDKVPGKALNMGIDLAGGDYIFFLRADDWLLSSAIENLVDASVETDADVVQGAFLIGGLLKSRLHQTAEFVSAGGIKALEFFANEKYASVPWNKLYRLKFLKDGGIRFPGKFMQEDLTFAARTAFSARQIVSISEPVVHHTSGHESLKPKKPPRVDIGGCLETYLLLAEMIDELGINAVQQRDLVSRIFAAHGSANFAPKLQSYYSSMGYASFREEMLSVAWKGFGPRGLLLGETIAGLIRDIDRTKPRLHHRIQRVLASLFSS